MAVRPFADGLDFLQRVDLATAAVVRVLQAHQPRPYQVLVVGPHLAFQLGHVKDAVVALDGATGDATVDRGTAGLGVVDVAADVAKYFVARLCVRERKSGWTWFPKARTVRPPCRAGPRCALEAVDSWILEEDVIANFGGVHGRTHGRRRPGDGIAAQIEKGFRHGG